MSKSILRKSINEHHTKYISGIREELIYYMSVISISDSYVRIPEHSEIRGNENGEVITGIHYRGGVLIIKSVFPFFSLCP